MTPEKAFNKRVHEIIKDKKNLSEWKMISRLKTEYNFPGENYYKLFNLITAKMGIGFAASSELDDQGDVKGHRPYITFYPRNKLNEDPGIRYLFDEHSILSLDQCYYYIANELIFRILPRMADNLESLSEAP